MGPTSWRRFSFTIKILFLLWLLQLAWLAWHFAPEAVALSQRLWAADAARGQDESFDRWLAELTQLLPPTSTYILIDCYETGNYTRMRYHLYPRRQVRLDPKTSPAFLFTAIQQEQAAFVILGGCHLAPHWRYILQEPQGVFQTLPTAGSGLVLGVDPGRMVGGFYD